MKNKVFIVFDSLRWDVFKKARTPFLNRLGVWKKAYSQGTYTLPAHMSFFVGKLPQVFDQTNYYDCTASRITKAGGLQRYDQLWRLDNPEAPRTANEVLQGSNIIEGFRQIGYRTIGTGAVNWFNPDLAAAKCLTAAFENFRFFGGPNHRSHYSSEDQVDWVISLLHKTSKPYFLFINLGETHHRFVYKNCPWMDDRLEPYGDKRKCFERQRLCLEYLDGIIQHLFSELTNYSLVMCADHGEAFGEGGLWGHGFFHKKVMEVPLLIEH